jgi:hypothetical protein
MTIFYCLRFEIPPSLDGKVPTFISPKNMVARLYSHALGFNYSWFNCPPAPLCTDRIENTFSNSTSIPYSENVLPNRCLETAPVYLFIRGRCIVTALHTTILYIWMWLWASRENTFWKPANKKGNEGTDRNCLALTLNSSINPLLRQRGCHC